MYEDEELRSKMYECERYNIIVIICAAKDKMRRQVGNFLLCMLIVLVMPASLIHAGELDIYYSSKSTDIDSYMMSAKISDRVGPLSLHAEYNYGKSNDLVDTDDGEISIGYDLVLNDKWSLWFDELVGYNKVLDISFENFIGFGPKYYLVKKENMEASISTGVLYQYQGGAEKGSGRYSHRLKYDDGLISATYFYQPNMRDSSDYISSGDVRIKLSDTLSVFYEKEYRSKINEREARRGIVFTLQFDSREI